MLADSSLSLKTTPSGLRFALGTKVRILRRAQGGTIEITFGSEAELNRIYEQITNVH